MKTALITAIATLGLATQAAALTCQVGGEIDGELIHIVISDGTVVMGPIDGNPDNDLYFDCPNGLEGECATGLGNTKYKIAFSFIDDIPVAVALSWQVGDNEPKINSDIVSNCR